MQAKVDHNSIHQVTQGEDEVVQFQVVFETVKKVTITAPWPATGAELLALVEAEGAAYQTELDTANAQRIKDQACRSALGLGGTELVYDL